MKIFNFEKEMLFYKICHFCLVFQNVFFKKLNESLLFGSPFTHMHVYKVLGGMDSF